MTFRVGQKVTMFSEWSEFRNPYPDVVFPEFGKVYTVREILEINTKGTAVRLFEIRNHPHQYRTHGLLEQPFPANNFRPVVSRETDISALKALLVPGARIKADA